MRVHEAQKGESHMKQTAMLTTASLLTILLMTFHLTGDILFKMAPAGLSNLFAVFIFVVLLCGTLLLAGRRAGYIIIFFGSVLGLVIPVVHMKGTRGVIGGEIGNSSASFLFRVDTPRVGYHRDVLHHPIGARTVELALAPESPRVNYRITPVVDICRYRPVLRSVYGREPLSRKQQRAEARTGSRAERTGLPPPLERINNFVDVRGRVVALLGAPDLIVSIRLRQCRYIARRGAASWDMVKALERPKRNGLLVRRRHRVNCPGRRAPVPV